ncbi:unnamed protein product [Brugia pahangi]|uniref:1,2-dihydroxy-3-keto-5-methylthiopentene dioxygenase n=1 Tax=Brugia pahangi TaxID=6280 RepID=A0A0N4TNG9_BRUPA|nr:unnamed protein product [Brugia pahangi]
MVQIWYMEPYPCGDPRLPHHLFPPKKITPDELTKRTGVLYFKIIFSIQFIEELYEETQLNNEMAVFVIEGSAYYDVEDECDNWLRILCEYGDLLIIPAGKLHRFTTTTEV